MATVITNLLSAIPWVGNDLVGFVWGGFSVDNATLNRFFSLHFLLPFILAALACMHLLALNLKISDVLLEMESVLPAHIRMVGHLSGDTKAKLRGPNGRITNEERGKPLPPELRGFLVGMILGDAYIRSNSTSATKSKTARISFFHGIEQADFVYHIYSRLIDFVKTAPTVSTSKAEGKFKERQSISFVT